MRLISVILTAVLLVGCGGGDQPEQTSESAVTKAMASIVVEDLRADIEILASDEYEGRSPSSPGEEKTIAFLRDEFTRVGLEPGNGDSFYQEVPLVEITADPEITLTVDGGDAPMSFAYGSDAMVWTKRVSEQVSLDASEMVFVGYGIVAPEYGWNDYQGLDVTGKTVVMLVNDPGYATRDENLFTGFAMTYYGRWTYKFEEAARQGAAGAIVIHDDGPAGYPWEVVSGSWSGPQFDLVSPGGNQGRCYVEGWVTNAAARQIFTAAGKDLDALTTAAATKEFQAESLGLTASVQINNTIRESVSNNVIAVWPGSTHADEYVFYTAHWDHLGKDPTLEGDQIYNGAIDNASGTAGLIEIAEAFTLLPERQARSIVFLAVTAEEQGLLGSRFYGENPVYPTKNTVAAINMDAMNTVGQTKDVVVIGKGASQLDDHLKAAADKQGRYLVGDPSPEKGFFYRSDHLNFAKAGVPALYAEGGQDHITKGKEFGEKKAEEYTANHYHKPSDEISDDWDLSGAVQDLHMLFDVGYQLSQPDVWPQWSETSEFRAAREKDRGAQ